MKKLIMIVLVLSLAFAFCACANSADAAYVKSEAEETGTADDGIFDPAWADFEKQGMLKTEKGVTYVYITLPEGYTDSSVTQKDIDAGAGMSYVSGTLNKDGSVTYKMTKIQHMAMADGYAAKIDKELQNLVEDEYYSFKRISHDDRFTVFDAYLTTDQVSFSEDITAFNLFIYGAKYALYNGRQGDKITVNFYSSGGQLISSSDSSSLAG